MRTDQPCTYPSQDRFGYLPTARIIARTLRHAPALTGLVLHVDGPWGSGKSSMLGLVEHDSQYLHGCWVSATQAISPPVCPPSG